MFKEMRRKKQQLTDEKCFEILKSASFGVLSLLQENGYTYSLPLNYVFVENSIIFHASNIGLKIDSIKKHDKVSFSVVGQDLIVPEEYTTYFKSVIVFGKIEIINDRENKISHVKLLAQKFRQGYEGDMMKAINSSIDNMCILKLNIEKITGKQAIELVNKI